MEVNTRTFIREYPRCMAQECQVTKGGEVIGVWIPYDKMQDYETED